MPRSNATTPATHGASKLARASRPMVRQGRVGEVIQLTRRRVSLQLAIPLRGIVLLVPLAKVRTLFRREGRDLSFELLEPGHA